MISGVFAFSPHFSSPSITGGVFSAVCEKILFTVMICLNQFPLGKKKKLNSGAETQPSPVLFCLPLKA